MTIDFLDNLDRKLFDGKSGVLASWLRIHYLLHLPWASGSGFHGNDYHNYERNSDGTFSRTD